MSTGESCTSPCSPLAAPDSNAPPSEALDRGDVILELEREMLEAADDLEFERAAYLRDQIAKLKRTVSETTNPAKRAKGKRAGERKGGRR